MQLFITDFSVQGNTLHLENKEILDQIRKVLRGKIGDTVYFQTLQGERYKMQITTWDKKSLDADIIQQEKQQNTQKGGKHTTLLIAIPNKRSKAELIAQKLTEIGTDEIVFRPAERSIIRGKNINKIQRIQNIVREASEQARRWSLPTLRFLENTEEIQQYTHEKKDENNENSKIIVFDLPDTTPPSDKGDNSTDSTLKLKKIIGIIGPEGGLTSKDYQYFGDDYQIQNLGDTVLRMETAAILSAWEIKKHSILS